MAKELADIHTLIAATAEHYQYPAPPKLLLTIQEFLTNFIRAVLDLIASLLSVVPGYTDTRAVSDFMKTGLYALGLLASLLLIWLLATRLTELGKQAARAKIINFAGEGPLTAREWQEQAHRLAAAGQWKDACRALLLATIRLLDEQKVVPFLANRSNFEYSYALSSRQTLRTNFRLLAETVDLCWFGNREADRKDFTDCQNWLAEIQSELTDTASNDPLS